MLSENFSPINRFDETATEKIFSQYSNQNTIQKKNLPLILSEMNELEGIYLIDEILQKIGVDLTDNDETALTKETFNFFLQTYFQTKEIKKQESFKTSFFSDLSRQFSPKLKGKPNPPSESSNEIIDIPNIDDVLKQNNHQKIDDIMKSPFKLIFVFFIIFYNKKN